MRTSIEVAKYIEHLLKNKNMKPVDLAEKTGVNKSTISRYFSGTRKIPMDEIGKFAEALNVEPSELLINDNEEFPSNRIEVSPLTVKIPILGNIACGDPILAEQNIEGYTYESADTLPHGVIFALIAKGDSMSPTIPNGATVLIREQSDVENGEIAAVLVNGDTEATLKRVKRIGSIVMLMPDNNKHDPIPVTKETPARIIGKAVRVNINL